MGVYSNFRGRRIDLTETLAYHLAAVTSLAHHSVAYTSFIMKRQQGILHAENAVGMCFLCLKSRSNGLETFRPGKSRGVGVSIIFILFAVLRYSEPPMSPSFCCWSEYVFRSGNLFRGTNQPLTPKMECHHHSGNMSYSNIPSSSTASCSRYFFLPLHEVRAFEADRFDWLNSLW